jgi:hypothetical protein
MKYEVARREGSGARSNRSTTRKLRFLRQPKEIDKHSGIEPNGNFVN